MSNWKYTNIQHAARKQMSLSPNEYCVYDIIYQSQTNPSHTVNGWAKNPYAELAKFLGFSKGTVFGIIERGVERGFIEVNPSNPKLKKTTEKWYGTAYLDEEEISKRSENERSDSERKDTENVQKVNAKRSDSERHIKVNRNKDIKTKEAEIEISETPKEKEVFASVQNLKSDIGPKHYRQLNEIAKDKPTYQLLRDFYPDGKFDVLRTWLTYRKEIKKNYTTRGMKMLISKFEKYAAIELQDAVNASIENGYQGIFPKKNKDYRKQSKQTVEQNLSAIFQPKNQMVWGN